MPFTPPAAPLPTRRALGVVGSVALVALASTACGGSSGSPTGSGSGAKPKYASGGTMTITQQADPGALDPDLTALNATRSVTRFAYDTLLNHDASGKLVSGLADTWEETPSSVTYHLHKGVTCADGAPLTATDVAANYTFVGDEKNASPLLGVGAPPGVQAVADDAAGTVILKTATPTAFLLNITGTGLQIICKKGLADRSTLAHATDGTGPYTLTEQVPNDHYTFTRRADYSWGPGGQKSTYEGSPAKVVVRVVSTPATAMNLLLAKQVNLVGPAGDAEVARAKSAGLKSQAQVQPAGELWLNQAPGRPGADIAVRKALVGALDPQQVGSVLTGGLGTPSKGLATVEPRVCRGDTVTGNLPKVSQADAEKMLDDAGWAKGADGMRSKAGKPLAFSFLTPSSLGPNGAPGTELLAATWKKLGASVKINTPTDTALATILFKTGDWDAGFVPLNVTLPTQYAAYVSGPNPPSGTNFAYVSNPGYEAAIKQADGLLGDQACAKYEQGEKALISDVDVAPLVDKQLNYFVNGGEFQLDENGIVPQSLKLFA